MKKILSLICVMALLLTCITGLAVSADTFPVTLDVQGEVQELTDEFYYSSVAYNKNLQIPTGWNYSAEEDNANYWHCTGNVTSSIYRRTNNVTHGYVYRIYGSWINLYRYVDIEPGYEYTITILASVPNGNKASTRIEMYNKDENDTYTEIEGTSVLTLGTQVGSQTSEGIYDATHSVTIEVTDANVNALKIKMGDESGNAHNSYAEYGAVTIEQGEYVGIKTPPVILNVTGEVQQLTDTFYYNEVGYQKSLQIPVGWDYSADEDNANYWHCTGTSGGAAAPIQRLILNGAFGTSYRIYGSWINLYRYAEIQPGYEYTITTLATVPNGNKASTRVEMYHNNGDGTYTAINEYLTTNNYENTSIEGTSVLGTGTQGDAYSGDAAGLYNATHSVTIRVTDASVNALKIKMGDESGNAYNSYAAYGAVTITQGDYIGVTPNPIGKTVVGNIDFMNIGVVNTPITGQYVSSTIALPNGCGYKFADTQWGCNLRLVVGKATNAQPGDYPIVYNRDLYLTKTFDVAEGYEYSIEVGAAAIAGNEASSRYWLMHKNADGTYTEINEYLTANGYEKTVSYDNTPNVVVADNTMDYMWEGDTSFYDLSHSFEVSVTDASIDAIMVGVGAEHAYVNNEYAVYTGIKVLQGEPKAIIENNKTTRDVTVTYNLGTNGGTVTDTITLAQGATGKVSLRPVTANGTKVVSATGYFKGWKLGETSTVYTSEEGKKAPIGASDATLTLNALWYTVSNNVVSGAQAQKVTLSNGKNVIRFLALVDDSYEDYKEVGFVFTTLAQNPTIEAGYNNYAFNEIYKKINVAGNALSITDSSFLNKFTNKGAALNPTGIVYANVVIASGDENTVYYATPYVEKADGTREYGQSKAISYAQLEALDVQ